MDHLKIAINAPPWEPVPPPAYGGIEAVVHALAVELKAAGHEVLLYTVGDSTCPVRRAWGLDTGQVHMGQAVTELHHVMLAYEAVQGFDIVHDHTLMGPVYAERYPALPVVTTTHRPFDRDLAPIYRRVAAHGVQLIAVSHSQRREGGNIPVAAVIHHGVRAEEFPIGTGEGGYVLFLGRMCPNKGVHLAIAAARKAKIPLLIAGKRRSVEEREYFRRFVEPDLDDDVSYLGEVDHLRKLELLGGARALLFPIVWNEPFGMVMIESFACGTPVLAYPRGAAPEVVCHGRTGFLCRDVDQMARAIVSVEQIDRRMCRRSAENEFSAARMAADHVSVFRSVLEKGSARVAAE